MDKLTDIIEGVKESLDKNLGQLFDEFFQIKYIENNSFDGNRRLNCSLVSKKRCIELKNEKVINYYWGSNEYAIERNARDKFLYLYGIVYQDIQGFCGFSRKESGTKEDVILSVIYFVLVTNIVENYEKLYFSKNRENMLKLKQLIEKASGERFYLCL